MHEEEDDACVGVGAADADVVESAVDAGGDDAGFVAGVGADAVVGVVGVVVRVEVPGNGGGSGVEALGRRERGA